jgi:hypothetical protein
MHVLFNGVKIAAAHVGTCEYAFLTIQFSETYEITLLHARYIVLSLKRRNDKLALWHKAARLQTTVHWRIRVNCRVEIQV